MFGSKALPLPTKPSLCLKSGSNPSNVELKFINKDDLVYGISGKNWRDSSSMPSQTILLIRLVFTSVLDQKKGIFTTR